MNLLRCRKAAAVVLLLFSLMSPLAVGETAALAVERAWSRPTPPGAANGVVYLSITNRGATADRLIALRTPVAAGAEIHESRTVDGMMQMRRVAGLDCPPHATVDIEPGGLHVMLVGLRRPLTAGMEFPLALRFRGAGDMTIHVHVREAP